METKKRAPKRNRHTGGKDRILINEDEVRYMDRPRTDEIYKAANID